jgi:hypothetical protein
MVMVDPNGILLRENRKAAGGCWLMALIRHIEEACDVSRKLDQVFMISPPDGSSNTSVQGARLRSCFAPREKSNSVFYQPLTPPTGLAY